MQLSPDSEWGQRTKPDYLKMSPRPRTLSRCWFPPSGPWWECLLWWEQSPSLLIFVFHPSRRHWTRRREPLEPDGFCQIPRQKRTSHFQITAGLQGQMLLLFVGRSWRYLRPGRTDSLEVRASSSGVTRGHGKMLSVDGRWHLEVLLPSDMYRMEPPSWVVSGTTSHEAKTRFTEDPQLGIFWKKPALTIHSWSPCSVCGPSLQWVGAVAGLVTPEIRVLECRGQGTNGNGRNA